MYCAPRPRRGDVRSPQHAILGLHQILVAGSADKLSALGDPFTGWAGGSVLSATFFQGGRIRRQATLQQFRHAALLVSM